MKRILLVEDDALLNKTVAYNLSSDGWDVTPALNAKTAADLLAQYDEACEQLEIITEQKQKAENLLKEMMGENEVGTAGDRIVTWKSVSQERLDSKTLKVEHPALCKKYTSKTSYRRFTIKAAS